MALLGKHAVLTAIIVAASGSHESRVILSAFAGGVLVDVDHLLNIPTIKRVLDGERRLLEQREKFAPFHSIVGLVLFGSISVIWLYLGKVDWWLPLVAFFGHAVLDSSPTRWGAGRDFYPILLWIRWPVKWHLKEPREETDEKVTSLAVSISGALVLILIWLGVNPLYSILSGCALLAGLMLTSCRWLAKVSILSISLFDGLLTLGWLYYFVRWPLSI